MLSHVQLQCRVARYALQGGMRLDCRVATSNNGTALHLVLTTCPAHVAYMCVLNIKRMWVVTPSFPCCLAVPAGRSRLECHPVPHCYTGHTTPNCLYHAAGLMANHHWRLHYKVADPARMNVCTCACMHSRHVGTHMRATADARLFLTCTQCA
jgi:hypothetical protein